MRFPRMMTAVFVSAIVLLASVSALSYRAVQGALEDGRLTRETRETTAQLQEVLGLLAEIQAAEALFALTAGEAFLEGYERARAALPGEMARLRDLAAGDPPQEERMDRLQGLQERFLQGVAETIEMTRAGDVLARRIDAHHGGVLLEARKVLAEMAAHESRLEVERDRRAAEDAGALNRALLALSATGLVLLGLAFGVLVREDGRRARAERDLGRLNEELEDRVRERNAQLQAANDELQRDISERKRLELTLRESETRLRTTLDAMLEGCQIIGFDWRYLYVNEVTAAQGRQPREALLGRTLMEAFPGIERTDVFAALRRSMDERSPARIQSRYEFPDGSFGWFELSIEPVPEGIFVLSMDVTQRKRAEEEREQASRQLREGEARYRRLVEHIREVVIAGVEGPPPAGRLTFVSPQVVELSGRTSEEFLADPGLWERLLHPEDAAHVQRETDRALDRKEPVVRFYRLRNERTGEYRWIEDTFVPDQGESGEARSFFATARDVTERWNAEAEALRLRHRNELLLNCAGEGICGLDREGSVTFINPKGAGLLGYAVEELIETPFHAKCHHSHPDGRPFPSDECPIEAVMAAQRGYTGEAVFWRKDGKSVPVECVSTPVFDEGGTVEGIVVVFQDISDRRRLEETVQQSQKLEAIGRLAGGVAHDFNNILGVITGYGELMGRQLDDGHPARPRLEQMLKAAERAAALTRQLLAFSRKQVTQPRILDLNVVTSDLEKMLRRVIGEDVELEVRPGKGLGAVKADPTQVEQVVMNLVVNARDAMPKGGMLTLELANVEFDRAYAAEHPPAEAGRFVMLAVSDTGVGMDAEIQKRIFDPFFTTKPLGEGTGLGLATVYGIVKQSGGHIWVYSELGRGTTFKVYLPRVDEPVEAAATAPALAAPRGNETVLVVEDTESLREMVREVLEERGYTLLQAADGEQALSLALRHQGPIHLLLTDVVMPKMGGPDLAARLKSLRPEMQTLFMSGYTDGALSRQGILGGSTTLLEKPFTTEGLARAVRAALDAPKPV